MLYNKYRPRRFTDVVGQRDVMESLASQSKKDRFFNVYILCGQFGSGKTTTARILAMAANCRHKDGNGNPCGECGECRAIINGSSPDVREVAAAVSTGVDTVREICETVSYLPVTMKKKVYIIDEVQALSKNAFQAFLKMLEEPPEHAVFILATTDVGAIPATVRSRAAIYYFRPLSQGEISAHCRTVAGREGFSVTDDACGVIARYAQGSMRNALALLEMACQDGPADGAKVESLLGVSTPDAVFSIVGKIISGDVPAVVREATNLSDGGADLSVLVDDLIRVSADLMVASVSPDSVSGTEHYLSLLRGTAAAGTTEAFTLLADGLFGIRSRRIDLPMLIVSLVRLAGGKGAGASGDASLAERLRGLEKAVSEISDWMHSANERFASMTALPEKPAADCGTKEPCGEHAKEAFRTESVPEDAAEGHGMKEETTYADMMEEDEYFALLGLCEEKEPEQGESAAWKNYQELQRDTLLRAVLSCCMAEKKGGEVLVSPVFPVAGRFLRTCLAAYKERGYVTDGITVC